MPDAIRVLIVDDEPPVIEGLHATIARELPGFSVVGSASNGREAIGKARTLQPDVLLLDVQMPGIDGIEALRTMREQGLRSIAILVTAYERFDVARRGYGLGVRDYLVKPVGPRTVREALGRAEIEIRAEREREAHVVEITEGNTRMLAIVERALLHLILAGAADASIVREMIVCLGLDGASVVPVLIHHNKDAATAAELADRLHYAVHGLVGVVGPGRMLALAFYPRQTAHEVGERIRRSLAQSGAGADFRVEVGGVAPLGDIPAEVETLSKAVTLMPDAGLFRLRTKIVRAVRLADRSQAMATLDEYVSCATECGVVPEALEALLVAVADVTTSHRGAIVDRALETIVEARRLHDLESAVASARRHLNEWIDSVAATDSLSEIVRAAVRIVREEFAADLSIDNIADRLNVSPSHLSRTFSAEVGLPLSAYLADLRIQRAGDLLEAGALSVKEIAARCGFRDPNYFSRAFRGATGLTPSEFARSRRQSVES